MAYRSTIMLFALLLAGCAADPRPSSEDEALRLRTETGRLLLFSAVPREDALLVATPRADGAVILRPLSRAAR